MKKHMAFLWGAPKNVFIVCIHRFLAGSVFSLGVFSKAVEQSATSPGALDRLWSSSMAITSVIGCLTMILSGVFVNSGKLQNRNESLPLFVSKTHRAQLLAALGALAYAFLCLGAVGVSTDNALFIRLAVALQGIPLGLNFLLYVELLASWMPDRRGLSIGIGFTAFGLGCIAFSAIFDTLLQHLTCVNALYASAAILVLPSLILTPVSKWRPKLTAAEGSIDQGGITNQPEGALISWKSLPLLLPFWHYVNIVMAMHPGYAIVPYFFILGLSFGEPMQLLVRSFQIAFLVNSFSRPFSGMLSDSMKWGHGRWAVASKNLLAMLFVSQMALFSCLAYFAERGNSRGVIIAAGLAIACFGQFACGIGTLARDMFRHSNSALVMGVGAGLGLGMGGFTAVQLMALFDQMRLPSPFSSRYTGYFICGVIWSFIGLLSSLSIQKCDKAFGTELETNIPASTEGPKATDGTLFNENARISGNAAISAYGAATVV